MTIRTSDKIAEGLEAAFAAEGFAAPGVDALRDAAGVSLRTLYRHYPSREAMVVGALDHRHRSYLAWLQRGMPEGPGAGPVLHVFRRLRPWMAERAPNGCLFVNALAEHPDSDAIREAVKRQKAETRALFADCLRRAWPDIGDEDCRRLGGALFVVHEGQTAATVTCGCAEAGEAALTLAESLLRAENIE